MKNLVILTLFTLGIAACGQKGPLIVDQPVVDKNSQTIDGEAIDRTTNDAETRVGRQVDGEPSIIYR